MTDKQKRVRLPDAKPGQVFAYENGGDGHITLIPLRKDEPKKVMLKLVKKKGRLVPDTAGLIFDLEGIAQTIREDRDSERGVRP